MDPISHVVFASSLVRTRERVHARGMSVAIALGALAPDIDLVLVPAGWDRYLVAHQAGTHSLAGALVCGALAAAIARFVSRDASYARLSVVSMAASLSHVVADLLTGGTIRVWWPFSDAAIANLGVIAFGDPYAIALFAVGGLLMWRWRARRAECAIGLLCALALFVAAKTISRERAETAYRARVDASAPYLVEPVGGSLTAWRIIDVTADGVRALTADASGSVRLELQVPRGSGDARAIAASREWQTVRNFTRAHAFVFAAAESGQRVMWSDVRYCPADARAPRDCAVAVGGESDPAGTITLIVRVGDWIDTRAP